MPISSDPWEDDLFPPCKNSLCPNDENTSGLDASWPTARQHDVNDRFF